MFSLCYFQFSIVSNYVKGVVVEILDVRSVFNNHFEFVLDSMVTPLIVICREQLSGHNCN